MKDDVFSEKLIKLLLAQQGKVSRSSIGLNDRYSNWSSVGETIAGDEYINQKKKDWKC